MCAVVYDDYCGLEQSGTVLAFGDPVEGWEIWGHLCKQALTTRT